MFDEEEEAPLNKEADRHVTKAAKRAQQRLLMKEELIEFEMSKCRRKTTFHSTDQMISKVEIGEEKTVSRRTAKRSKSKPEESVKAEDPKDEDEDPTAKTDLAKTFLAERGEVAKCQDVIEVVTEHTSAREEENETPGSKKIKNPLEANAKGGDSYEDFVDNNAKNAEENEERPNCPNNPSTDTEQVPTLAPQTPAAQEVSNTRKNRKLEGNDETKETTAGKENTATTNIEELEVNPTVEPATSMTKARMYIDDRDNAPDDVTEAINVKGAHTKSNRYGDTPAQPEARE
jgi:hypothetical protein